MATLIFYGPDNRRASKAVLGIFDSKDAEPQLHKWFAESSDADLRYDIKLQNACLEIIQREGVRSFAMMEEINGCPHEEGIDYPLGEVCPVCPFWANRRRPAESPTSVVTAIASYKPDQWEELLASAADRETLEETWEEWNADVERLIADFEARGLSIVRVPLDIEEIKQYCEEHGVANDGQARANLAALKAEQNDERR